MNRESLYMAVSPDKYELPIAVADDPYTLSCYIGGYPSGKQIQDMVYKNRSGKRLGMKFVRVWIDNKE